jgi:hypothetical protein
MPAQITAGSMMACSFGAAPAALGVSPANRVTAGGAPAANILDFAPGVNVPTFGMCSSLANPAVATATTAALGVLTPMPCLPLTVSPWTPGVSQVLIAGAPALNQTCTLNCGYGGVIQFTSPAQTTVQD